jgi:hypothetical protein
MSDEQCWQRSVSGATRWSLEDRMAAGDGGELLGVVLPDLDNEGTDHDVDEARRRNRGGRLKLGSRYVGKVGLVAEMPLSRTIFWLVRYNTVHGAMASSASPGSRMIACQEVN